MKFLLSVLLSAILLCIHHPGAYTQEYIATPVEISTEKVRIKGELYYVHKVLKGQTLYSIAKKYNVTTQQINKANPSLSQGLKSDMIIYIPTETTAVAAQPQENTPAVEPPAKEAEAEQTENIVEQKDNSQRYITHRLKWYESLKDVAKKYGVPLEAIYSLNNIVPPSKKRIKSVMIPDEQYIREMSMLSEEDPANEEFEQKDSENTTVTSQQGDIEDISEEILDSDNKDNLYDYRIGRKQFDKPIKVSVVLPFNVADNTENLSGYVADFYCGILLAADHLKENGEFDDYTIETIDLSEYASAWEMISSGVLEGSELVIGPISARDMHPVASYCQNNKIPIVSPLDNKTDKLLEDNPYLFLFPSNSDDAIERQVEKLSIKSEEYPDESVTVLYEKGYEESYLMNRTIQALQSKGINYNTFCYNILEGRDIHSAMESALNPMNLNKVIIPSHSEAFISDAMRNLHLIQSTLNYNIEVYGMSKWKTIETLDTEYFHQLNLHLAVPYNIDYNNQNCIQFINGYIDAYNTEPTPFSFQGYDILTFFVTAMNEYGKKFPAEIINSYGKLLQSDICFVPVKYGSGAENKALKDIVYKKGWIILEE